MEEAEDKKSRLFSQLTESGGSWRIKNALTPILWLCGLVAVPCIITLGWSKDIPSLNLMIVASILYLVVLVACLSFVFLLFYDRDRLQSEDYHLQNRKLDLYQEEIEQKGSAPMVTSGDMPVFKIPDPLPLPAARQPATPDDEEGSK